ncbi:hypothetical protein EFL96_06325 [Lactococcus lactis]|uniref:Phage XkdN-like protein n=1 Tax=Lactococcus lactis TaxID=1358 RepID=A0A6B3RTE4_9LACT|nr:hypothetical protein [Lactococcus lactis]MCT1174170.1 hypothetical protein [Lactococcus lactis]MCT1186485.1 hypothetical protein [Lactococcus lactis]MCT1189569.1 hypothetical protein [Lactococcus lactis]NEX49344.1 hypothetical protein [Lactococcus lactis]NEX52795.1 hypothetical protein [Lactococcus lactis]
MTTSIKDFILKDITSIEETKEIWFPQFKSPFVVRSIGAEEFKKIQDEATITTRNRKTGVSTSKTDGDRLIDLLIAKSVVTPDLSNDELQKAYGTTADAAGTARKMLKAGQYGDLVDEVQKISGFDVDDMVEELKK